MANENIELHDLSSGDCWYYDLSNLSDYPFSNSILHLNVRSFKYKLNDTETLLMMLNSPKALVLTETWLKADKFLTKVLNYSFVFLHRVSGSGGGVGMYLHDTFYYQVIENCVIIIILIILVT